MNSDSGIFSKLYRMGATGVAIAHDLLRAGWARFLQRPSLYCLTTLTGIVSIYYISTTLIDENYKREVSVLRVSRLDGGTYQEILTNLEALLRNNYESTGLSMRWTALKSGGAMETAAAISANKADIGIVQEDTTLPATGIRALATFNEEPFLWFSLQPIQSLKELKRQLPEHGTLVVATGKPGSMTLVDFEQVLGYYGLSPQVEMESVGYDEAYQQLTAHLISNAFFVAGPFTEKIERIESIPGCRLLSLDQTLTNRNPGAWFCRSYNAGAFTAEIPSTPIETIATRSVLVVREGLSKGMVRELARLISNNQQVLKTQLPYLSGMQIPPDDCIIPLHPGVAGMAYHSRFLLLICSAVLVILGAIASINVLMFIYKHRERYYHNMRKTIRDLEPVEED